jgi:hypothetical protein
MRGIEMFKNILIALFSLGVFTTAWASDLSQQQSVLYPFQTTIAFQDDFLGGNAGAATTGSFGWTVAGTATSQPSIANRLGIIRFDTSAVSGTISRINFFQTVSLDPAANTILTWVTRLNTNDANTTYRQGVQNTQTANPPAEGIYIEKLDADTNWFCVTRAGAVQTRTDSTVAVTTAFATFRFTRNSSGVQFSINNVNVCGLMTTNIPTVFVNPEVFIINSAAASKTVDVDYFELTISGLVR